jgi:hypothetical protein
MRTDIESFLKIHEYSYTEVSVIKGTSDIVNNMEKVLFCRSIGDEDILVCVKLKLSGIEVFRQQFFQLFFKNLFIDRHLGLIIYYLIQFTLFVCKFRPQESQSDVLGDLHRISMVVGSYFGMPPLLLPGLEPASPGTPTMLTRVRCLSLKPDMDREVGSHPDSRISAKVQS